jgi:WD40 repeat protein
MRKSFIEKTVTLRPLDKELLRMRFYSMFKLLVSCVLLIGLYVPGFAQDVPRTYETIPFAPYSLVEISPDVSKMLVVEPDQTILIYDLTDYEALVTVKISFDSEDTGAIKWAIWKDDSSSILFKTVKGIFLFNAITGEIKSVYTGHSDEVTVGAIAFFQESIVARVGTVDVIGFTSEYETYAWDAQTLEQTLFLPVGDDCLSETPTDAFAAEVVAVFRTTPCLTMLWSPDQTRYLFWNFWNSGPPEPIEVYDADTQTLLFELRHCATFEGNEDCEVTANLEDVRWSPDGTKIVSLPEYSRDLIHIWDGQTGELLHALNPIRIGDADFQLGVVWHGSEQLATWESSSHILVWDVETGELIFDWYHDDSLVKNVRWIRDGQLTMTWGDGTPWSRVVGQIWNARSGEKLALMIDSSPEDVVEDPDRGRLFLILYDRVEVWYLSELVEAWKLEPAD